MQKNQTITSVSLELQNNQAYVVLVVLTTLNLLNYIDRFIFAALIPYIKIDTNYTDEQIGLIGSAFTWVYTIFAPLFGYLGDRKHRGKLISMGVTIWSLATAAAGITRNFPQLLFSRSIVGIGEANYATISPGLLSDFFPKSKRGLAMSIFMAAIPLGTAAGYLIGGYSGAPEHMGWRSTLYLVGLPGLLMAIWMLLIKEPKRGAMDMDNETPHQASSAHKWYKNYLELAKNKAYVSACLGYAAVTFAIGALVFWAPEWLKSDKGLSVKEANNTLGICAVFGGTIGTILGGIIGDWFNKHNRSGYFWICSLSSFLAIIPTIIAICSKEEIVYKSAIFIAITIVFFGNGPVNTLLVNVVPINLRSTAVGLVVVIIHFLGDGISLSLVGSISTWASTKAMNGSELPYLVKAVANIFQINPKTQFLSIALLLMPIAMLLSGLMYLYGIFFYKKLEKAEKIISSL